MLEHDVLVIGAGLAGMRARSLWPTEMPGAAAFSPASGPAKAAVGSRENCRYLSAHLLGARTVSPAPNRYAGLRCFPPPDRIVGESY